MYGGSQFNDASSPERGGGGGRKGLDERTVIPVTIRQILNASMDNSSDGGGGDGGVMLRDGRPVHLVKLVGAVRGVEDLSTNVVFSIEDGTGLIDVKQWHDPSDCAGITEMRMQASQDNCYVRVIGQLKGYEGKITVVGLSIRRVSTCNELTHHFLETVYSSEKSKRSTNTMAPQGVQQNSTGAYNSSMGASTPFGAPPQSRQQPLMAQNNMGGSAATKAILEYYMQQPSHEQGIQKAVVIKALSNRFQESQTRQAFDELSRDGKIYSTISEDYFQIC